MQPSAGRRREATQPLAMQANPQQLQGTSMWLQTILCCGLTSSEDGPSSYTNLQINEFTQVHEVEDDAKAAQKWAAGHHNLKLLNAYSSPVISLAIPCHPGD